MSVQELRLPGRYSTNLVVKDAATEDCLQIETWEKEDDAILAGVTLDRSQQHMLFLYLRERLTK